LEQDVKNLQKENHHLQDTIDSLEQRIKDLEHQLGDLRAANEEQEQKIEE